MTYLVKEWPTEYEKIAGTLKNISNNESRP